MSIRARWEKLLSKSASEWKQIARVYGRRCGYRAYRLGGEFLSVSLSLGIVALFFGASLLIRQSADLTPLRPAFERWFSQSFGGATAELNTLRLQWNPSEETVSFIVSDLTVYDLSGEIVQTLDRLEATSTRDNLFQRKMAIRDVRVVGGEVSWVETANGEIIAGIGTPDTVGGVGPIYRGSSRSSENEPFVLSDEFRSISLERTQLYIQKASDGLDISVGLDRLTGGYNGAKVDLHVAGVLRNSDAQPAGTLLVDVSADSEFEWERLEVQSEGLVLSRIAPPNGRLSVLSGLDLPIALRMEATNQNKNLQSASFHLSTGEGLIKLAGEDQRVNAIELEAVLDPGEEEMEVERVDIDSERLMLTASGRVFDLGRFQDGDISTSPKFDLEIDQAIVDATPVFAAPIALERADLVGEVDLDTRTFTLDSLLAQFEGFAIAVSGEIVSQDKGLSRVSLMGTSETPLTAPHLLSLWPVKAADGARRWIDRSVLEGTLHNVAFDVNLDEAFFETPQLDDGLLELTFDVRDGVVRYISTMDPLVEARGSGRIDGNRFGFVLEQGRINDITIIGGDVDIPRLTPKGGDILITAEADGDLKSLMGLIDQPPFRYLERYGASPDGFGGSSNVTLSIERPLLEYFDENRIEYSVSGTFKDARSPFKFGPYALDKGDLQIEGGKEGLFLTGIANLGPWRANLSWAERYGQNGEPTRYRISGPMDRKTLDGFGLGFREIFGGEIDVDIEATGAGLNVEEAYATVDLTRSELALGQVWSKSVGEVGEIKLDMRRDEDRASFPNVTMQAPGLDLKGSISMRSNMSLEEARLDQFNVEGLIEGKAALSRNDEENRLVLEASGRQLNVSSFVMNALERQDGAGFDLPLRLDASFDEIVLGPDYELTDAVLNYRRSRTAIEGISLRGVRPDGDVRFTLQDADSNTRIARLTLPDVSNAVSSFLGIQSVRGGNLELEATLPPLDLEAPILGTVLATDFKFQNAPFLAQILSLASLTGFVDALSGEGLSFNELSLDFGLQNQVFTVRDGKLRGPSLGMTGEGEIDLSTRSVDFGGTLVPAYTANSILQDIPLFGDLLVGRDGEGVFAVNYNVSGPFSQSLVTVNPLSALTPGFIRGIFRESREDLPEDMKEAIEKSQAEPGLANSD